MKRTWWILGGAGVVALTVVLFWPCLANDLIYYWDDDALLMDVREFLPLSWQSFGRLFVSVQDYYKPLTMLTFVGEHTLWPNGGPRVAHAISVGLHAVNGALVLLVAAMIAKRIPTVRVGERAVIAFVTAAVFAWHPMQVEAVAWMVERKTLLCATFILGGLGAYLRAFDGRAPVRAERRWWWLATALFVAAAGSKPMAISFPVAALALDVFPLRRLTVVKWWKLVTEKWVWWILMVVVSVVTLAAQKRASSVWEADALSWGTRPFLAMRAGVIYLWKIVWPAWLSPLYPQTDQVNLLEREWLVPVLLTGVIVGACVWGWRRHPEWTAVGLGFGAFILPISGLMQSGAQTVADRYVYLAIVPVVMGLVGVGVRLWREFSQTGRWMLALVAAGELCFFAQRTREEIPVWRDDLHVWQKAYSHFPKSGLVEFKLSMAYLRRDRYAEALPYAQRAAESFGHESLSHGNLGLIYVRLGRPTDALVPLQRALELNPQSRSARYNLACALAVLGRTAAACQELEILLSDFASAWDTVAREPALQSVVADPDCQQRLRAWQASQAPRPGGARERE